MLPRSSFLRQSCAAALVVLASVSSVLAVRGRQKPYAPEAPAYRQQGEASAPVIVVEYSDFQCPACRFAMTPVKELLSLYGKDLRLIFKHYPLVQHPLARAAAEAAECAGRQGRFWEFHDKLYGQQAEWTKDQDASRLSVYAKDLGLDTAAFAACLKDPAAAALVEADRKEGDDRWVLSTPTFFINGKRFAGSQQLTGNGIPWIDKILKKK